MMRVAMAAVLVVVAMSGCLESETSVDVGPDHDHCWIFCGGSDTHVHFDFTPLLVMLLVLGLLIGIIVAAAASGKQEQQQQVVVYVDREERRP